MNQGSPDELSLILMFLFMGAFAGSFLISWPVKFFYRREVEKEMGRGKGRGEGEAEAPPLPEPCTPDRRPPEVPLEFIRPGDALPLSEPAAEDYRRAARARSAAAFNYTLAGCVQAVASTLILFYVVAPWLGDEPAPLNIKLDALLVFLWPVVWTLADVVGADWLRRLAGVLVYFGALVLLELPDGEPVVLWLMFMSLPTLARAGLANHWLKAVGTAVMVFTFVLSLGYLAATKVVPQLSGGEYLPHLLAPLLLLVSLIIACVTMTLMAWRHRKKWASDQTVLIDTHMLLAAEWAAVISFGFDGGARWYAFVPLFFAALRLNWLTAYVLFRCVNPVQAGPSEGLPLLLLRVFEPRGLSWWRRRLRRIFRTGERLLEGVGLHWRYAGSIQLITGTDVAAATLEVDELIEFVTGRLERRVVKDESDIKRRFDLLDPDPDLDGRFRVNEFVCRDDTWRKTVRKLFGGARAVLVDLRGFAPERTDEGRAAENSGARAGAAPQGAAQGSPQGVGRPPRRGITDELEQLFNIVSNGKLLLVTDRTTDEEYLRSVLQDGWDVMKKDSPNCVQRPTPLRVLEIKRPRPREVKRVVRLLFEAARSPDGPPAGREEER